MAPEPNLVEMAKSASKDSGPVMLVVLAHDCPDSKAFQKTFDKVAPAFGGGLMIIRSAGSHKNRDANPEELKQALTAFAYDKTPGDEGGNQRGHFPCGAIYVKGEEVARLPSDTQLATMSEKSLANFIQEKTSIAYDLECLSKRGDIPKT